MNDNELLQALYTDMQSVKGDMQSMKDDMQSMKDDMQSMKSNMQSMQTDISLIHRRIDVLEFKQERTNKKLDDLQLDVKIAERNIKRDVYKLQDEMETVVEVMRQHELIPG